MNYGYHYGSLFDILLVMLFELWLNYYLFIMSNSLVLSFNINIIQCLVTYSIVHNSLFYSLTLYETIVLLSNNGRPTYGPIL